MKQVSATIEELPQVLTAQHIADYLHLARLTIYELYKLPPEHGGIPNFKVGKSRRTLKTDFINWIGQQSARQHAVTQKRIKHIQGAS